MRFELYVRYCDHTCIQTTALTLCNNFPQSTARFALLKLVYSSSSRLAFFYSSASRCPLSTKTSSNSLHSGIERWSTCCAQNMHMLHILNGIFHSLCIFCIPFSVVLAYCHFETVWCLYNCSRHACDKYTLWPAVSTCQKCSDFFKLLASRTS